MNQMALTIVAKSDQLNAADLIGTKRIIEITGVDISVGAEQPVSMHYVGEDGRPFKPCKTARRQIVGIWGDDHRAYIGRKLELYTDPEVMYAGQKVGGIRICAASNLDSAKTITLRVSQKQVKRYTIEPLRDDAASKPEFNSADAAKRIIEAIGGKGSDQELAAYWAKIDPHLTRLDDGDCDAVRAAYDTRKEALSDSADPFEIMR